MNELQQLINNMGDIVMTYLPLLQAASILLTAFFLAAAFDYAKKSGWFRSAVKNARESTAAPYKQHKLKAWKKVVSYANSNDENGVRLAIIEADKLLDEVLRAMGLSGADMGERLKQVTRAQFPNLDDIWAAHKVRNRIAHEPDFALSRDIATQALKAYEKTFRDFGVID